MKKLLSTTLILTMFLTCANYAAAKHNITADEDKATPAASTMFKGMHQTHRQDKKAQKKHSDIKHTEKQPIIYSSSALQHQTDKVNKHYQKVLRKIAKSSFSKELRNLLSEQATENRDLALKQLKEKMDLCAKHACERMQFQGELKHNEHAHKLIEKVDNI